MVDTGLGISSEGLEQLFAPFERLGADRSGIEGSGLGLALSRRLVELMGGSIGVDSRLGEGSTFHVDLPMTAPPADSLEPAEQRHEEPSERSAAPRTLLYIEDNLSNLRLIERILEHRPEVRLISAMQGSVGLDLARQHRPDLVLLDLDLPDISGAEVLRRLLDDPRTSSIPVVIISADATRGQTARLKSAGAFEYVKKPIEVRQFLDVLASAMERSE